MTYMLGNIEVEHRPPSLDDIKKMLMSLDPAELKLPPMHKPKYNIIFLDMDGVLCAPRACYAVDNNGGLSYLDPIGCLLVKKLCVDFDCKLVISSTWRYGHTDRYNFGQILNAACANLGDFIYADDVNWRTPSIQHDPDDRNRRGSEIRQWIKENDLGMKNFVILDDDSDIGPYQDHFAKCDVYDGLTFKAYQAARAILGDK